MGLPIGTQRFIKSWKWKKVGLAGTVIESSACQHAKPASTYRQHQPPTLL
jgi:hypothetical protein